MTRPRKNTVDYFPHTVQHGKTMFILESKWGNDGYATWFKILEHLGSSENHVINLNDDAEAAYLAACCKVDTQTLFAILDQCSAVNAIQPDFWRKKLVYSPNFIQNIADAYRKRLEKLLSEQELKSLYKQYFPEDNEFQAEEIPESDGLPAEEIHKGKGKGKGKEEKPPMSPKGDEGRQSQNDFLVFYSAYPRHEAKEPALRAWKKMNGTRPPLEVLLRAIEIQKQTDGWQKEDGKYIPLPASWLNAKRWEDEVALYSERKEACER